MIRLKWQNMVATQCQIGISCATWRRWHAATRRLQKIGASRCLITIPKKDWSVGLYKLHNYILLTSVVCWRHWCFGWFRVIVNLVDHLTGASMTSWRCRFVAKIWEERHWWQATELNEECSWIAQRSVLKKKQKKWNNHNPWMNSSYVVFQTGDDDFRTIKKITKTRSGDVVMVKVRRLRVNVTLCASVRELGDTDVQGWVHPWVGLGQFF